MKKILVLVLILTIIGGASAFFYIRTTTPEYSLYQIKGAITNRDTVKFEDFVDTETVINRLVDDVLSQAVEEMDPENGAEELGTALGIGLAQMLKPRLVEKMKKAVLRFVEDGGVISEDESKKDSEDISLGGLSENIGFQQKFSRVDYIKTSGKISKIGLKFKNTEFDIDLILELKMSKEGSRWRLREFSNFLEITKKIVELKSQKLEGICQNIQKEIDNSVYVDLGLELFDKSRWDTDWLRISGTCKNFTDKQIEEISMRLEIKNKEHETLFEQRLWINEFSGEGPYIWEFDLFTHAALVEIFKRGSKYMYDNMHTKLQVREIKFNGKDLKIPDTYEEAIDYLKWKDVPEFNILPPQH